MSAEKDQTLLQLFRLNGKNVLITGANGYLGSAMARGLADAGANIIATSRRIEGAISLIKQLPRQGEQVHYAVELDHLVSESIDAGINDVQSKVDSIDVLVNNGHEATGASWPDVDAAQFNRQLTNATGYFLLARKIRDLSVARQRSASVIMIGSMYGQVASYPEVYEGIGPPSPVAYHALKGGILQMTRHLAVYWAKDRIRVNSLSPGPFPAPTVSMELKARISAKSPMGRIGRPEELQGAIVFLASDASSYVTGHDLVVDGGWTAW